MARKKNLRKMALSISGKHITASADETSKLGEIFANVLKPADVVFLKGELGSGKTTFVKGAARGAKVNALVRSSSFILVSEYSGKKFNIYHIDLYRLKGNSDFENLGLEEYLFGSGVSFVEWADKISGFPVSRGYEIDFKWLSENKRQISIEQL